MSVSLAKQEKKYKTIHKEKKKKQSFVKANWTLMDVQSQIDNFNTSLT